MKCGNDSCKFYLAGSCTSSRVFLNGPTVCRLQQLSYLCVDCNKKDSEICLNCIKGNNTND